MTTYNLFYIEELGKLHILETFFYYDRPTLFSCESLSGQIYLALWIEDLTESSRWFYVPISKSRLSTLKRGLMPLSQSFYAPEDDWIWEIQYYSNNHHTAVRLAPKDLNLEDLPDPDVFLNSEDTTLPELDISPIVKAERVQRDVLDLSLETNGIHENEINAEHLGLILVRTQALLRSIPYKEKAIKGRLPKKISEETTVNVVGFYAASFGVRLESKTHAGLFGETPISSPLETFMLILNSKTNEQELKRLLNELSPRATARYRFFLRSLRDGNITLKANWASPSRKSSNAQLTFRDICGALGILEQEEINSSDIYTLDGTLVGINTAKNSFVFHSNSGDKISGTIDDNLKGTVFEVPTNITIEVEETLELSQMTQDEKFSYKLLRILFPDG